MARGKRYQPEQVVNLLRQIEVAIANGKTTARHVRKLRSYSTYFRWRKGVWWSAGGPGEAVEGT
jgi:hypothetical protein